MKKVIRVDINGFFVDDLILDDNGITPINCIDTICPDGLYKPKWTGSVWIEGLTQVEIDTTKKQDTINNIKAELDSLDLVLPRSVEDTWTVLALDTTKLPQIVQDRLTRKIELRNQLSVLIISQ